MSEVTVEMKWPDEYPVESANTFRASRFYDEVQFMYGYIPINEITEKMASGETTFSIGVQNVRSLSLSARAFKDFYEKVNTIFVAMDEAGAFYTEPTDADS